MTEARDKFEDTRKLLFEHYAHGRDDDDTNDALVDTTVFTAREEPEVAWRLILAIIQDVPADKDLTTLGAGPLEALIESHGASFVTRIEQETLKSARFREVLSQVWKRSGTDEAVWQRLHDFVMKHRGMWCEDDEHDHSTAPGDA